MQDQPAITIEQESAGHFALELAGELTPLHAAEFQQAVLPISQDAAEVVVRCEELQSLDLASLQILLALGETLTARQASLRWSGLAPTVVATIDLAGLREMLKIDAAAATTCSTPS